MHVLASIASGFTRTKGQLFDFFGSTFFAYEYGMDHDFKIKIEKVLRRLQDWDFIKSKTSGSDFVSAAELEEEGDRLIATPLGMRVSELYIDPETAHDFVTVFETPEKMGKVNTMGLLDLFASTTELRPLLRVRKSEEDEIWGLYYEQEERLLTDVNDSDYLDRFKTALMLNDWLNERSEEYILESYGMAPGLLRIKLGVAEWLAYSCAELIPYMKTDKSLAKELQKLQIRTKHGIKEELIPLVAIKGIGRVRARKLFGAGIKGRSGLKKAESKVLESILGEKTAKNVIKAI
jgi:helicase